MADLVEQLRARLIPADRGMVSTKPPRPITLASQDRISQAELDNITASMKARALAIQVTHLLLDRGTTLTSQRLMVV